MKPCFKLLVLMLPDIVYLGFLFFIGEGNFKVCLNQENQVRAKQHPSRDKEPALHCTNPNNVQRAL